MVMIRQEVDSRISPYVDVTSAALPLTRVNFQPLPDYKTEEAEEPERDAVKD